MGFKERLKEARLRNKLTQEQVAEKIGVAKSTFTGYEKGHSEPNIVTVSKIMNVLKIDANFLWQDEIDLPMTVSYPEMEHIKKYRSLDSIGRHHVDTVIDWETARLHAANVESIPLSPPSRLITYLHRLAAAGNQGEYLFNDIPTDTIAVAKNDISDRADFAIGVSGDSMEPTYCDGDIVLVQKVADITVGDIGIFIKGNECFIKEAGGDRLISHNKKYNDIIPNENIVLVGQVLGKAEIVNTNL